MNNDALWAGGPDVPVDGALLAQEDGVADYWTLFSERMRAESDALWARLQLDMVEHFNSMKSGVTR